MEIINDQFIGYLRSALHFLYDPSQLRRSPLIDLFNLAKEKNPSAALQKILIDAIEKIRPSQNEPPQAHGWLLHDVLFLRYVRGYEREAVMNQLGLSDRQLSREQKAAIETLAQFLARTFNLLINPGNIAEQITASAQPESFLGFNQAPPPTAESTAFSWVENIPTEKFASWKSTLQSVIGLLLPILQENQVYFEVQPVETLPDFRVPQSTLRHSLMNIIGVMIPFAQGHRFSLAVGLAGETLQITAIIHAAGSSNAGHLLELRPTSFEAAISLLERVKGKLELTLSEHAIITKVSIPVIEEIPILLIDDNHDTIQLFQRYVQGTRYSIVSTSSTADLLLLIEKGHPRIILLDLMMPGIDGWDILSQLRQAPLIPPAAIIVCSILPMEKVAQSLGADGFLQKPVLPQDFLNTIDDQLNQLLRKASPGKE